MINITLHSWSLCPTSPPPPATKGRGLGQCFFGGTDPVGVGVSVKFLVCSATRLPFEIFWWQSNCRTGRDNLSRTRMTTLELFFLLLSLVIFWKWLYMRWYCVHSVIQSNTPWNILMILCRDVEHDKTQCYVLEWQLSFFYVFFIF